MKFPHISTFDHEGRTVVNGMRERMFGLLYDLKITPKLDVDKRVKYTDHILIGPVIQKYCT